MAGRLPGASLRSLVLTPEKIPDFLIPTRSPRLCLLSPRRPTSPDRMRLLSSPEDAGPEPVAPRVPGRPRPLLRAPRIRLPRRPAPPEREEAADPGARAALTLKHLDKVTTPYGFREVLASSPCTGRRESLFHRGKGARNQDRPEAREDPGETGRSRVGTFCLQAVRELRSRSPRRRK